MGAGKEELHAEEEKEERSEEVVRKRQDLSLASLYQQAFCKSRQSQASIECRQIPSDLKHMQLNFLRGSRKQAVLLAQCIFEFIVDKRNMLREDEKKERMDEDIKEKDIRYIKPKSSF
mmetsp:Transcript_8576/g.14887  ORF Transcript_8576/g.14887 Transcript_8576/m.14887 type:complete len:118 (+) Transcript_8576:292-645(+)